MNGCAREDDAVGGLKAHGSSRGLRVAVFDGVGLVQADRGPLAGREYFALGDQQAIGEDEQVAST